MTTISGVKRENYSEYFEGFSRFLKPQSGTGGRSRVTIPLLLTENDQEAQKTTVFLGASDEQATRRGGKNIVPSVMVEP